MMDDMPKKTDSKERMVAAARRLFREHGYLGTALSDVVTESAAPRGSIYFHFPGGKEELAVAAITYAGEELAYAIEATLASQQTLGPGLARLIDAPAAGLDFNDHECNDISVFFRDQRFRAVTVHEIGKFFGVVSHSAGKTCFVDLEKDVEIRSYRVPDESFHG